MRFNLPSRPVKVYLLLALPVLVYVSVTIFWHARALNRITGDEPHYLLIAESLVRDRDLRVENNYFNATAVHRAAGLNLSDPVHLLPHTENQYSRHNIGLPILLAVPYAVGGVLGAQILMALIAGLWPLLLYRILLGITSSRTWSLVIALTLAIGLPFTAESSRIAPDLVAGLIILFVAWKILTKFGTSRRTPFSLFIDCCLALLIAFLPWLHIRFTPPAILLLVAYIVAGGVTSRREGLWRSLLPAAIVLSSIVLLGIYQHIAFANTWGPYSGKDITWQPREILMVFLGLHWDQSNGLFIQQPLFLLALVGIPLAIKKNLPASLLLGSLYFSVLLPCSMHTALYGGSFFGRFWWSVFGLWIFPLAYAIKALLKQTTWLLILCFLSVAFQIWLATNWLPHDEFLMNRNLPMWTSHTLLEGTRLTRYLPSFADFNTYLQQPANYVVVGLGILLVFTTLLRRPRTRNLLVPVWLTFSALAIGAVAYLPPAPFSSWYFQACDLPAKFGTIDGYNRIVTENDGHGIFTYGPYVRLRPGRYKVNLSYESAGTSNLPPGRFSVVYDQSNEVAGAELSAETKNGACEQLFDVNESQSLNSLFEFRVGYHGRGYLKVRSISLTPVVLSS